jgi:excisionase family DNA binding protein
MMAEYVTVTEAAALLDVSPSTVWRWIERGDLSAFRKGRRRVLLRQDDVRRAVRPRHVGSSAPVTRPPPPVDDDQRTRALAALREFEHWQEIERERRGSAVGPATWELIREGRDDRTRRLLGE